EDSPDVLSAENTVWEAREWVKDKASLQGQATAFVVVGEQQQLLGTVLRKDIFSKEYDNDASILELIGNNKFFIYPDKRLSMAVDLLEKHGADLLPVIEYQTAKLVGVISHKEVFKAYSLRRDEEFQTKRAISLKREGIKIYLKGKRILK